ncbi:MAG: pyridoxamine 5'-phosphate oxidase family protein [Thaumarchaeota archaeon]|nr:pyridoxamine 5'-phosphate oxidase family protein [Nitrososphaerota archaeon]
MVTFRRSNRQYEAMDEAEVWAFISSLTKMIVTFSMPDGYPHATPVWFVLREGKIYFRSQMNKTKSRLAGNGKVCCVFEDGEKYTEQRGCIVWGECKPLEPGPITANVEALLGQKYGGLRWGAGDMPSWWISDRTKDTRVYFEITPAKVSSWDNRKLSAMSERPSRRP